MTPIELKSGRDFSVTVAPFADSNRLMKVIARELAAVDFALDVSSLSDLSGKDINILKNAVLQLLQSEAVESAVMACAARCNYDGQRITPALFDKDENARRDYLPIVWEVIKVNLTPFFVNLDLSFLTRAKTTTASTQASG